ncbi:MAG TPA: energy transducer TonB [Candidatus Limnocylindrales bacterium]|nr:energy transducer TonB [Candidatus Limnocylindrales bacterium]
MQAGLVALALLYPLVAIQPLNASLGAFTFIMPPPAPGPPAPANHVASVPTPMARIVPAELEAPRVLPRKLESVSTMEAPPDLGAGGPGTGPSFASGVLGGILSGTPDALMQPAPLRIGGEVMEGRRLDESVPVYPPEAIKKHIMGTVTVTATISPEGRVVNVRVVSGNPLLVKAALECISQFRYQPTMLNGFPVEVETTINVVFRLIPFKAPEKKAAS